ncbi:MAG: type II toxin-antitoxin system HicA family toxin [Dehalococcoidia bacterium]
MAALKRAGFKPAFSSTKGSHLSMSKVVGSKTITTVVILDKREVPRGTLRGILQQARLTRAEFLSLLGRKKKRRRDPGFI